MPGPSGPAPPTVIPALAEAAGFVGEAHFGELALFVAVGFVAQFTAGAIGMAYGVSQSSAGACSGIP